MIYILKTLHFGTKYGTISARQYEFSLHGAPSPQVGLPFLLLFGGVTPPPPIHPSSYVG
jgi:hypothetical protein